MDDYTQAFGLTWAPVQQRVNRVRDGAGVVSDVDLEVTWSVDGPVHIELLQEAPGSVWTRAGDQPLHHICYWVDDLDTEAARLRAAGFRLELTADGERELNRFAYFVGPDGIRVEPKPEASRPDNERWLAGGDLY